VNRSPALGREKEKLVRKKLLMLTAAVGIATAAIAGVAYGHDDPHAPPHGHGTCTWTVDKTASLVGGSGAPITALSLASGQTARIQYSIVVTRTCTAGFDPAAEGSTAQVIDASAPAGTFPNHVFLNNANLRATATFTYTRDITASGCESFSVVNKVDVIDSDPTRPFATDTHRLDVTVQCAAGCTLTQGYWKTHSKYGPASKPDATWNLLPGGAGPDTVFFKSGASWITVFRTAPAGNAYYNLAHQYMAARLNLLAGAAAPANVTSAVSSATSLFETYTPAQIGALKGSNSVRQQFISLAETLGAYNEGQIGPGHCD
jgi:hypothetical protein